MSASVTALDLRARKSSPEKITMVTAYDATFAALFDEAGVDALLVGDSLGMVIQGHDTTLPVTLDHIIYHSAAVRRGAKRAHLVADMPFMSYQVSVEDALRAAGRLMQEGAAQSVKLEGGRDYVQHISRLVRTGIPVMGHLGLTPQSVHQLGGFKVQGRTSKDAQAILEDAKALEDAGCYAIVLEAIPADLAAEVTASVGVPTIGIGAGPRCDGQVLVGYDLLGLNPSFKPKFVKRFATLGESVIAATQQYIGEVRSGAFPGSEHSFGGALRVVDAAPYAAAGR
jgi:3-methyl-2-oxobutanoate hydroxymethyltransferase